MFVLDRPSSKVIAANRKALERTGFLLGELQGLHGEDLFGIDPRVAGANALKKIYLRVKEGATVSMRGTIEDLEVNGAALAILALEEFDSAEERVVAFSKLGHRLCSARGQREAIQIILEIADQFFGWDACTFDKYDSALDLISPVIVIDHVNNERVDVEPIVKDTKPTPRMRKVIDEGAQLILRKPPIRMAPDSVPMGDQSRPSASIMWVPIRSCARVIGLLSIQSYAVGAYTNDDMEFLQALADHGAGALERIQAEERIKALNVQLEQRVEERTSALQEAVRELEAFSYSISHDMRAPLRAMEGYTKKVVEEFSGKTLDGDAVDYLLRTSRAAVRLDMLIQDVLTYTNVARCDAPLQSVDMEELLADLIESYPDWRSPNVTIEIVSPLPKVCANEALLTQCLSHLIDNAIKFVVEKTPQVRIWAEAREGKVRTWIEDNGPGIEEKDRVRVFNLFERIHPSAEFRGTGVGLTIVKKAVERMNGSVGFSSELGKGSKFWFELAVPSPI